MDPERGVKLYRHKQAILKNNVYMIALLVFVLLVLAFAPKSHAFEKESAQKIASLLDADEKEVDDLFLDLVKPTFKYVTSRSLTGKSGDWLAFVDVYQEYKEGKPLNAFILQRASVQYGLQKLPASAENSVLFVGSKKLNADADSQSSFTFSVQPIVKLPLSAQNDSYRITVSAGKSSASILLTQNYPGENCRTADEALKAMAPAFYDYAAKSDANASGFDHSFLRLKSFVSDVDKMERSYTWELYLVKESKFPCKAVILRYDCDTEKVSIVNKEIRNYFS